MGKRKKVELTLEDFVERHKYFYPHVSASAAKEMILKEVRSTTDKYTINESKLRVELEKIDPSVLTLLCHTYLNYGQDSF